MVLGSMYKRVQDKRARNDSIRKLESELFRYVTNQTEEMLYAGRAPKGIMSLVHIEICVAR